ncbi:MAG: murein transglycosylase A [Candidatus Binatia bacterium]
MRSLNALFLCFLFFSACRGIGPNGKGEFPTLLDDLDQDSLRHAIQRSLDFLERIPKDRLVGEWPRKLTAQEVRESLLAFIDLIDLLDHPERLLEAIRSRFDLYQFFDTSGEALFTGYYRPVVEGSLSETPVYRYPIYRKPEDIVEADLGSFVPQLYGEKLVGQVEGNRFVPYFSRYEIDTLGRLRGRGYEIAWVKDPVELFFLHVQGSGLLRLEDGRLLHLNYAASNGRPYTSIGRLLIDRREIPEDEVSMERLRRYLMEHPEEREDLLAENERYIFFRFVKDGALGNLDVPLTPGRSIATDSRLFPKGALAFITAEKPIFDATGKVVGWQPFSRFVLNQDTGGSIRGPGRVDLYFGTGPQAGAAAGYMKSKGKLYLLAKKGR